MSKEEMIAQMVDVGKSSNSDYVKEIMKKAIQFVKKQ